MSTSITLMAGSTRSICEAWHLLRELERSKPGAVRGTGMRAAVPRSAPLVGGQGRSL